MPKANLLKRSFSAGQVSKLVWGRTDSPAYENGAREITNFMVRKHGALTRRPGSRFIGNTKYGAGYPTRLKGFTWSSEDSYVLEIGGGYIRIWRDEEILLGGSGKVISALFDSAGQVLVSTIEPHGFTTGDTVAIDGSRGSPSANGVWTVTVTSTLQFILNGSAYNVTMAAGGIASNTAIDIPHPYNLNEISELNFCQSADVMWFCHKDHPTMALTRYSNNIWQFTEWEFEDGPYLSSDASMVTVPVVGTQSSAGLVQLLTAENGFISGNVVEVKGVLGTTEANGNWQNSTFSADKVRLLGSTYANAYAGGGIVRRKAKFNITNLTDEVFIKNAGTVLTQNSTGTPANGFVAGDVNWLIEVNYNGTWRLAKITARVDAQNVKATLLENYIGYMDPKIESRAQYNSNPIAVPYSRVSNASHVFLEQALVVANPVYHFETSHAAFTSQDVGKWFRPNRVLGSDGFDPMQNPGRTTSNWYKIGNVTASNKLATRRLDHALAGLGTDYTNAVWYNGNSVNVAVERRIQTCRINADMIYFKSTDVGRHVRFMLAGLWSWGKITSVVTSGSSNYAVVEYYGDIPVSASNPTLLYNNGMVEEFRIGAWSETTGYPKNVVFHGGRLTFSSTEQEPQTFWMSEVENYKSMKTTERDGLVTDDLGITFTLASRELDRIQWMISHRVLLIGTTTSEWQIRASTGADDALTPGNVTAQKQSSTGSADGDRAVLSGTSVVFVQRELKRIMEMTFNWEVDAWEPVEISAHAEGMWGSIREMALQQSQDPIIWFRDSEYLYGCTFNKNPDVIAFWKVHFQNNSTETFATSQLVPVSMAVIPRAGGSHQDLYVQILDVQNSESFILVIDSPSDSTLLVDKAVVFTPDADGLITGLNTYFDEGETVTVSETNTEHVVSGGSITLPEGSEVSGSCSVGYKFISILETLPMDGGSMHGTSMGKVGRQPKISLRFTPGSSYRIYEGPLGLAVPAIDPGETFIQGPLDATEVKEHHISSDYKLEQSIRIQSINAAPLTIIYYATQQYVFE